jgi:hypothetical protein
MPDCSSENSSEYRVPSRKCPETGCKQKVVSVQKHLHFHLFVVGIGPIKNSLKRTVQGFYVRAVWKFVYALRTA